MASSGTSDRDHQPGFAVGKRVWFKTVFPALTFRAQHGLRDEDSGLLARKDVRVPGTGEVRHEIDFPSATVLVPEHLLRLTPPPGSAGAARKAVAKPKGRKEAVDPEFGEELELPL